MENDLEQLLPIKEDDNGKTAVDARMLHDFLGSNRDFSNWIKDRIEKCDLIENEDFEVFTKFGENPNGGRPSKEYALSIDAAKEISMMEGNDKGKQARRYFIACEKKLKGAAYLPKDYPATLRALADSEEQKMLQAKRAEKAEKQVLTLSSEIETMKPKVNYYDTILASKNTVTTTQVAQDYGMSVKALNKKLAELQIQHKVGGQWILYAPYISQGYMHSKAVTITHNDDMKETKLNSEWTQKGRLFLYDELKKYGVLPKIEQI